MIIRNIRIKTLLYSNQNQYIMHNYDMICRESQMHVVMETTLTIIEEIIYVVFVISLKINEKLEHF